jgi:hypothetical protein
VENIVLIGGGADAAHRAIAVNLIFTSGGENCTATCQCELFFIRCCHILVKSCDCGSSKPLAAKCLLKPEINLNARLAKNLLSTVTVLH